MAPGIPVQALLPQLCLISTPCPVLLFLVAFLCTCLFSLLTTVSVSFGATRLTSLGDWQDRDYTGLVGSSIPSASVMNGKWWVLSTFYRIGKRMIDSWESGALDGAPQPYNQLDVGPQESHLASQGFSFPFVKWV